MHGSTLALRDLAVRNPVRLLQWAERLQAVGSGSQRWRCAILCIGNLVTSWKQRCRLSCRGGALGSTEALSTDLPVPITALALANQTVETEKFTSCRMDSCRSSACCSDTAATGVVLN
jgi:hypothetical protein